MRRTTLFLPTSLKIVVAAVAASSLVWGLVLAYASSPAQAAQITVNSAADTTDSDGCTTDSGGCTLREAINAANASTGVADAINFNLGGSPATITLGSQLPAITDSAGLIIDGGSANITISGNNKYRVFEVGFVEVTLSNLTVANGAPAAGDGGGILNSGTLTVSNSTLSGNSTAAFADGGGILNSGTLTVSNSTISRNSAGNEGGDGGGIYNLGGMVTVSNSTISGNSATNGGGINNNVSGTTTVSNSTISGNSATSVGGGIAKMNGTLEVSNSTISGNSAPSGAGEGGGIFLSSGPATVSNSTISGNSAGSGGGILLSAGTVTVSNSTISDNSASIGGGIYNKVTFPAESAMFKNTIVAANHASVIVPDVRGSFTSQGHNLIGQSECTVGCFTNEDIVGTTANPIDPMLGPLANNGGPTMTHALLEGSPAIDKGVAVEGITTDQRGFARPQGAAPDIGSFESEFTISEDTIKPHVSTAKPTGPGIARGTNLAATFSEKMDPLSITKSTFKLFKVRPDGSTTQITNVSVKLSTDGLTAKLNPFGTSSTLLAENTKYKGVITTGAKDVAGNQLDQDPRLDGLQQKAWTFTTNG